MKPEKLTTSKKYRHFALVNFTRSFPIDGLRYDRAFPWKEVDGRIIEDSMFQIVTDVEGKRIEPKHPDIKERRVIIACETESTATPWSPQIWNGISGVKLHPISYEEAFDYERNREGVPPRLHWELKLFTIIDSQDDFSFDKSKQ